MRWKVTEAESGKRLDIILRHRLPQLGRAGVKRLLENKAVSIDGNRPQKSWLLRPAQLIEVAQEYLELSGESPLEKEISILHEDDAMVVLDKPPGLATVSLKGSASPSVAQWLNRQYPQMREVGYGPFESGLIHRLDTYTSGLLISAKTKAAFEILKTALKSHEITKTYLALTQDEPAYHSGTICTSLQARGKGRVHVATPRDGSSFESHYRTLGSVTPRSGGAPIYVVEVKATAAYRHQVRAHLADLGAPLLGDKLYGGALYSLSPRHALVCTAVSGELKFSPAISLQVKTNFSSDLYRLADFTSLLTA